MHSRLIQAIKAQECLLYEAIRPIPFSLQTAEQLLLSHDLFEAE